MCTRGEPTRELTAIDSPLHSPEVDAINTSHICLPLQLGATRASASASALQASAPASLELLLLLLLPYCALLT